MSLNLQAKNYFLASYHSKGRYVKGNPPPHPRVFEFNRLRYFWKEFGLNKRDLDRLSGEWADEMYMIGMGFEDAKNEIESKSASSTPIANSVLKGNVQRTKLQ